MRIAIAQMPMGWTLEENTRSVVDHLARARALSAELALFPECSTTGYHRRVPEQVSRPAIAGALDRIRARCAALALPAIVGTPFYPSAEDGRVWNAAVAIDAAGEIQAVCPKGGLTRSEHRFFHAATARPVFSLGSVTCSVLLCREVRDAAQLGAELSGAQVVFWPGLVTWDRSRPVHPDDDFTVDTARECARTLGTHLVQCNWPHPLNDPTVGQMGGSLVISPAGEVLHQCPIDEPGISLIDMKPN